MTDASPDRGALAVIVPAYKARFLAESLDSLAGQTDPRFRVYVGDDASPEPLSQIVDRFRGRLDIVYQRFNENAGRRSLVAQWNRCVALSSEPWVWLFSDDDVADPRCVAAWRETAATDGFAHELYRFRTRVIDEQGATLREPPAPPARESALAYLQERLERRRLSYACEHVIARTAFDREGGFIDFPLAWCSDDASWAAFARRTGMVTVPGAVVGWRWSGSNISGSITPAMRAAKREAILRYLEWLAPRVGTEFVDPALEPAAIRAAMTGWFWHQLGVADVTCSRDALRRMRAATGADRRTLRHDQCQRLRHNLITLPRLRVRTLLGGRR